MKIYLASLLFLLSSLLSFGQEKLIKVNGKNFNVYVKGFENRKKNSPAIIFENGLGVGLGNWDTVIDQIAKFSPVIAYDRAGVEKSEKIFQMPTIKVVTENLKAILTTLNISPPYILVGHSLGGLYVRGFAGIYPNDISGPREKAIGSVFHHLQFNKILNYELYENIFRYYFTSIGYNSYFLWKRKK